MGGGDCYAMNQTQCSLKYLHHHPLRWSLFCLVANPLRPLDEARNPVFKEFKFLKHSEPRALYSEQFTKVKVFNYNCSNCN